MNSNQHLQKKWIDADHPAARSISLVLVNQCVVLARDSRGAVKGLTFIDHQDFSSDFAERLLQRVRRPENKDCRFEVRVPKSLIRRVEQALGGSLHDQVSLHVCPFVKAKVVGNEFVVSYEMRVVNVDDSPVLLKFLKNALESSNFIKVVAQTSKSLEAIDVITRARPDIVTLDIQMPEKNGVQVLKDLLAETYYPVIMISSLSMEEGSLVFDALNNGAFDYQQKPRLEDKELFQQEVIEKMLNAVAGNAPPRITSKSASNSKLSAILNPSYAPNLIWCLGASTGGTQALTEVFTSLPGEIPPTLVVQHIPPVFSKSFATSLNQLCPFEVKEAEQGEQVRKNCVYIAPGGLQMGVEERSGLLYIQLSDSEPVNRFKPSVDYMFSSVAGLKQVSVVAGVLTGMGKDGAQGLLSLKNKGARTFAQDQDTSTVYGMPRAAFEIGASEKVVPLGEIAHNLLQQSSRSVKAS